MHITQETINQLTPLVKQAGDAIMEIYNGGPVDVETKDDNTPLTKADKISHQIIVSGLRRLFPDIPVISEEGDEAENLNTLRQSTYWIVDPLDGTREFVNRTGEFCVAVGLVDGDSPVFGIVSIPVSGDIYFGGKEYGAYKISAGETAKPIFTSKQKLDIIAVSRSRTSEPIAAYINENHSGADTQPLGSMLKQVALAEGKVDAYPVIDQPMSLWDVAAGMAVIEGAGGSVERFDGSKINWHESDDLKVGDFIARSGADF